MSPTETVLLLYAGWTILLLLSLGVLRSATAMTSGKAANSFSPTGDDLGGLGKRLTRAHANCYENLPAAGALLLYAIASGQTSLTDGLAYIFLAARIAQSLTHITSTSNMFVMIRFGFFIVQNVILVIWLLRLLGVI